MITAIHFNRNKAYIREILTHSEYDKKQVENYEQQHFPEPDSNPVSILKHFMRENNLRQKDLPELGGQSVVSEILNGKRQLNIRQIDALSKRFNVPKAVFV